MSNSTVEKRISGTLFLFNSYNYIFFLLAKLGPGEGSQGSNPQSCSACPRVVDRVSTLDVVFFWGGGVVGL
jgi:hypothetical protein